MGAGYKGNVRHYHSVGENLSKIKSCFLYNNGFFGISGDGGKDYSRHIVSENPLATAYKFYNLLSEGGIESKMRNDKGIFTKMKDGTVISYREYSSSDGSPVVDINIKNSSNSSGIRKQKIHFIKEEK